MTKLAADHYEWTDNDAIISSPENESTLKVVNKRKLKVEVALLETASKRNRQ